MPHNGLPPEVVDEILFYLEDDKPALLSCMLASKAFLARADPVMYRRHQVGFVCHRYYPPSSVEDYKLDQASERLAQKLQAKQECAQRCSALTVRFLLDARKTRTLSATPCTAASLRVLFERLSAVTNLTVTVSPRWSRLLCVNILAAVLPAVPSTRGLRSLCLPGLTDDLLRWLLPLAHLTFLTLQQPILRISLPTLPATFRLAHIGVDELDADLFTLLTTNSLSSLTSFSAPYSFPFESSLTQFTHLTSLTLTFDRYSDDPSSSRSPRREALKHFLEANTTLRSLTFSHGRSSPGPRRSALLRALPPHIEVLRLRPCPLSSQTALDLVPDLPVTLRKVEWTPWTSSGPWTSGRRESVEEACKARGVQEVVFTTVEASELDG
ncbi:hypothetical protein JCM10213_003607 [Rhodosporidiobolus nylandii]